jgi:acyl-coenzyme A synthetase/AMP-(fatty) acid ligase
MEQSNFTFDLIKQAEATPDAPALLLPDREINYEELNALTWRSAQYLHDHGVRAGNVVAMTFASELSELIAILAVARIGATVLSLPSNWTDHVRAETVSLAKARCLVSDMQEVNDYGLMKLILNPDSLESSPAVIHHAIAQDNPESLFVIVTGSGSTGRPKRFAISHPVFLDRMVRRREAFGIIKSDRFARLSCWWCKRMNSWTLACRWKALTAWSGWMRG